MNARNEFGIKILGFKPKFAWSPFINYVGTNIKLVSELVILVAGLKINAL